MPLIIFLALYVSLVFGSNMPTFGCLNNENMHVDWWVIYKESGGERYIYKDPLVELHLSEDRLINDSDSPLVTTVESSGFINIVDSANSPFYVAWNDQPTNTGSASLEFAHAKGFMGIKNTRNNLVESFFIQHSLPRFPLSQNQLFDSNITTRAQHFVCISMRDEFTGQSGTDPIAIQIDSVIECNFFKLFWRYARIVNVNFLDNGSDLDGLSQINTFKEILISLPNYPIDRFGANESGVRSQLDLTSFTIESTGNETNRLTFQIFAKAPNYTVDIYDDVTALFSIHHDDYNADNTVDTLKTAHLEGKTAMIMIAQSHYDPATLGINQKILADRADFFATVHILNSARIKLPSVDGELEIKESMYRDHSKWSVNVVYGLEGNFPPLLCFYDLNRSTKQAKRGGGAFCLNSSVTGSSPASLALWELFMSFCPDPNSMARLNNANINEILGKVLPKADSEIFVNSPPPTQICRFTRGSSSKKRRHSIVETIPMSMIRSASLSKAEYSDENDRIKIWHPNTDTPSNVSCPYKFCTAASNIKCNGSIPTKMILNIDKAVENYGFTKLNEALFNYKLIIMPTDVSSQSHLEEGNALQTPSGKRQKSLNTDFTPNTVVVKRKQKITGLRSPKNSSSSEAKTKISNLSRSCVKFEKLNRFRPNTNPRTKRSQSLRFNSINNIRHSTADRKLELNEDNFMRSAFLRSPKLNGKRDIDAVDEGDVYDNIYTIANANP